MDLVSQFGNNAVFIGLVGATLTGSILYLLRALPKWLWLFCVSQTTVRVFVKGDEEVYEWISKWLAQHPYTRRARNLRLTEGFDGAGWAVTPGHGEHLVWEGGWPIWIHRNSENTKGQGSSTLTYSMGKNTRDESYVITTLGRSQKRLHALISKANTTRQKKDLLHIKVYQGGWWQTLSTKSKRSLESVFLPKEMGTEIVEDAKWFFGDADWFLERGVPYRRGYLFYGLPGAGKTSLVTALASHFDRPIYYLNLNSILDDNSLMSAFLTADKNCILLLEDIDSVGISGSRKPPKPEISEGPSNKNNPVGVTLSGLLNAIDGAASAEGRLLIMTTNHPENLDSALLRGGRVDMSWEFGTMENTEALMMVNRFFPGKTDLAERIVNMRPSLTASEWQKLLMRHRNNPEELVKPTIVSVSAC